MYRIGVFLENTDTRIGWASDEKWFGSVDASRRMEELLATHEKPGYRLGLTQDWSIPPRQWACAGEPKDGRATVVDMPHVIDVQGIAPFYGKEAHPASDGVFITEERWYFFHYRDEWGWNYLRGEGGRVITWQFDPPRGGLRWVEPNV